jgi:hypothetical protein
MKAIVRCVSALLAGILLMSAGSVSANAASDFDSWDFVTDELYIYQYNGYSTYNQANFSLNWSEGMHDEERFDTFLSYLDPNDGIEFYNAWIDTLYGDGNWLVVRHEFAVGLYYSPDADAHLELRLDEDNYSYDYKELVLKGTGTVYSVNLLPIDANDAAADPTKYSLDDSEIVVVDERANATYAGNAIFLSTFGTVYPAGYEGKQIPDTYTPPAPTYVAMGDSFSSGEGNPTFIGGTNRDREPKNQCHRSKLAYPYLLANDPNLDIGPVDFVACSGATVDSVLYGHAGKGNWNEGAQIDALSEDTEVVTITIGGNDVGFVDYVHACALLPCGDGTFDYNYIMNEIDSGSFHHSLEEVYESILDAATNAQVYVIGYPYLSTKTTGVCGIVDMSGAWEIQNQLNAVIKNAVDTVSGAQLTSRIQYIDPNGLDSPFLGNTVCSSYSDFHELEIPTVYSFHPNKTGQLHYKELIGNVIN